MLPRAFSASSALGLLTAREITEPLGGPMGRILLGVIIGVILVIWLLVSCVGAIF